MCSVYTITVKVKSDKVIGVSRNFVTCGLSVINVSRRSIMKKINRSQSGSKSTGVRVEV